MLKSPSEPVIERELYSLLHDSFRIVEDAIRQTLVLISKYPSEKSTPNFFQMYEKVRELGDKADESKRRISDFLAKISGAYLYKEDFLRLLVKIHKATDYMEGISHRLFILARNNFKIPQELIDEMLKLAEEVYDVFQKLKSAFFLYGQNMERAVEACRNVDEAERRVDRIYRELQFKIVSSPLKTPVMMLLNDITGLLEDTADMLKDASDEIRCLAISRTVPR